VTQPPECKSAVGDKLDLLPGYYIYIGSAFGPGGVRARMLRHLRADKPKHWHIDYLREFCYSHLLHTFTKPDNVWLDKVETFYWWAFDKLV